ncbi:Mobile element protein [Rhodococcus sp. WAY2]|nr:Mobile element protein [Rhodococcus sp. WAY2]
MRTELVTDAIEMAVRTRGGDVGGVIFHSDRGSYYTAAAFVDECRRLGIRPSRGRVGSSDDDALAESFFQGLKREWLHGRSWTSKSQARLDLFDWLSYFNRRRRHSALGYLTPVEFEQRLIASSTLSIAAEIGCPLPRGNLRPLPHPRTGELTDFLFVAHGRRLGQTRLHTGLLPPSSPAGCAGPAAHRLVVTPHQLRHT